MDTERLKRIHAILQGMADNFAEVRTLAFQAGDSVSTNSMFTLGEVFGVLYKAKSHVCRDIDSPPDHAWPPPRPIDDDTPKDRPILVYAAPREGLPGFKSTCRWHPDAGFCVDELREATHWWELPPDPPETTTKGD